MTNLQRVRARLWASTFCALMLQAAHGAEQAAAYRKPEANPIHAQAIVDSIRATHPELLAVGIHAARPGEQTYRIVASTLNVIGKECDAADLEVAVGGKTVLTPIPKISKLGILLPLRSREGGQIGGLALAFKYDDGDDQAKTLAQAVAIRDAAAKEIASLPDLLRER